jgi:hypothetical protein
MMVKHEPANWYAVQTRARNEKVVCERLQEQGLATFLPLVTEVRRWSDRKKKVELPLFSCYVFVRLTFTNSDERMRVYRHATWPEREAMHNAIAAHKSGAIAKRIEAGVIAQHRLAVAPPEARIDHQRCAVAHDNAHVGDKADAVIGDDVAVFGQLDGGHIVYAILRRRAAYVSMATLAVAMRSPAHYDSSRQPAAWSASL